MRKKGVLDVLTTNRDADRSNDFPDDNVDPKKKLEKDYALRAFFACWNYSGSSKQFWNSHPKYETNRRYSLGMQDYNQYKSLLGVNPNQTKKEIMRSINYAINNYATKRINILVEKISERRYDPVITANDPLSTENKEDFKAKMKVYLQEKAFFDELSEAIGQNLTPGGLGPDELPLNDEEIDIHVQMNMKERASMELEQMVNYHLDRNRFEHQNKSAAKDLLDTGIIAWYVGMDENMVPFIKRRDPARLLLPYSEDSMFSDNKFRAYVMDLTVAEVMKMGDGYLTEDEMYKIEQEYAHRTSRTKRGWDNNGNRIDDVKTVRVLHMEYRTQDWTVGVERKDKYGNKKFYKKDFSYYASKAEQEKFRKKYRDERKLVRSSQAAIYHGYWVVDSDICFRWEKKKNQELEYGAYGEALFGYKLYAPNMYQDSIVSLTEQMIPMMDDLQMYTLKLRQTVVNAIPKGFYIDLHALRSVELDMGNGQMQMKDLIDMFMKNGVMVIDTSGNYNTQGNTIKPLEVVENGLSQDALMYIQLIQHKLAELDEVIGLNAASAASPQGQYKGKGVAQMEMQASDIAQSYLYSADKIVFEEICKSLMRLSLVSLRFKESKKYREIFGSNSVDFSKGVLGKDLGLFMQARPTAEEWQEFYAQVARAVEMGKIPPSAQATIMEIPNLKQARRYLAVIERRTLRKENERALQDIQANGETQMQSAQMAHQFAVELKQIEAQSDLQLKQMELQKIQLEHQLKMAVLEKQIEAQSSSRISEIHAEADANVRQRAGEFPYDIAEIKEKERASAQNRPSPEKD